LDEKVVNADNYLEEKLDNERRLEAIRNEEREK
jgi:hypothetical protein